MKCPECDAQQMQGAGKPIKEGYLLKHKKRVFGKDWKEIWLVLYEDSTIAWYKHKDRATIPNGKITIKEAPEMLAAGRFTFKIPGTPALPPGTNYNQLMAFGSKNNYKIHWLLAASEDEVNEWMKAISNTLPLAPSAKLEAVTIRVKNDKILIYNSDGVHIGSIRSSAKTRKNCQHCCSACDTKIGCTKEALCVNANTAKASKTNKMLCETGTGLLMGTASANVTTSWRGWGEGLGWNISGLSGASYNSADHMPSLASYDLDNGTSLEHGSELMESACESSGILAFDFFL